MRLLDKERPQQEVPHPHEIKSRSFVQILLMTVTVFLLLQGEYTEHEGITTQVLLLAKNVHPFLSVGSTLEINRQCTGDDCFT
eukprot:5687049-Amphidinium_carterae.2